MAVQTQPGDGQRALLENPAQDGEGRVSWAGLSAVPACFGSPFLLLHLSWLCHGQGEHLAQALSPTQLRKDGPGQARG